MFNYKITEKNMKEQLIKQENNTKRFVLFYPEMKEIDLVKDSGMLLNSMTKLGYKCEIHTFGNSPQYRYVDNEIKNVKLQFVSQHAFKRGIISYIQIAIWLAKNSKSIDIMMTFRLNVYISTLFSLFNKKGIKYIKLDGSLYPWLLERPKGKFKLLRSWKRKCERFLLRKIDLCSIETRGGESTAKKSGLFSNLVYLPNGYSKDYLDSHNITRKPYLERKKQILFVGSLEYRKGLEILLEAFALARLENWKVIVVGELNKDKDSPFIKMDPLHGLKGDYIEKYIEPLFKKYPYLTNMVEFKGGIKDRGVLSKVYLDSRIFCLPSRHESFGLVSLEAASSGAVIICSNVGAAEDITNCGEFGFLFNVNDVFGLSNILKNEINNDEKMETMSKSIFAYVKKDFCWDNIAVKLHLELCDGKIREKC